MPTTRYKPTLHNPFPELSSVAVLPFYNKTGNPNVDGREFALHYANELQRVPGFKVIANETVEKTMLDNELLKLESVDDIRYLAQLLKVDAIVVGQIHDFSGYYPPRVKLQTEWYAVNPYLHPIPFGYGLPWGTEYEGFIPDKIALLAEKELATAQIKTQTPEYEPIKSPKERLEEERRRLQEEQRATQGPSREQPKKAKKENPIRLASGTLDYEQLNEAELSNYAEYRQDQFLNKHLASTGVPFIPEARPMSEEDRKKELEAEMMDPQIPHPLVYGPWPSMRAMPNQSPWSDQNAYTMAQQNQMDPGLYQGHYPGYPYPAYMTPEQLAQYGWANQPIAPMLPYNQQMPGLPVEGQPGMVMGEPDRFPGLPTDWPDPRGFIPEGPQPERPARKVKSDAPVLSHIAIYDGNDAEFMQALQDYDFLFRDDKRIAGERSLLNNRGEFIRFCCRMHIWQMLGARGGAGTAERVVREWKIWKGGERPY